MQRNVKQTPTAPSKLARTKWRVKASLCCTLLMGFAAVPALSQNNIYTAFNDVDNSGSLRSDAVVNLGGSNDGVRRVGQSATPDIGLVNVYFFQLPSADALAGETSLEFSLTSIRLQVETDYNTDVYGLGYVSGTPTIDTSWYYEDPVLDQRTRAELGTGSTGTVTRIFDDYFTPTSNLGRYETGPSTEVKNFLQSLYDDGAVAGDYAVIRLTADQIVSDSNLRPPGTGYNVGIDNEPNRPYNPAALRVGPLPEVADTFGGGSGLVNDAIIDTYQTGYGFAGNWKAPDNPFAANAIIGRPTFFEPDQPEPIVVTTGLGTFDGGFTGARITGDFGFVNSPIRRELATPAAEDVYFRYILRVEMGFDSDDLVGLWLDDAEGGDETDHTQDGVMLGIRNGGEVFGSIDGTTTAAAATINEVEDNLLIGRLYEASPGSGLNRLDFWLNPDSESEAPLGTVSLDSNGLSAVTHVGFMTSTTTELEDNYLATAFALAGTAEQIGFVDAGLVEGDFNMDGKVDAADYTVWRDTMGDPENYQTWKANFGLTVGTGSAAAVPEPVSAILLLLGISVTAVAAWSRARLN